MNKTAIIKHVDEIVSVFIDFFSLGNTNSVINKKSAYEENMWKKPKIIKNKNDNPVDIVF